MNKKSLYAIAVAAAFISGYSAYNEYGKTRLSGALLANVEALADNESKSDLSCEGFVGICSFKCAKCGTDWKAIGSHMKGSHKCVQ